MMRTLVLVVMYAAASAAGAAQPLGRLFFSPAERAQLDAARVNKQHSIGSPGTAAAEPVPPSQVITYSGIVRRSDGKAILWLNNRPAEEKDALRDLALSGRVERDGAVTLHVPQTGGTLNLKVGQRAELQTGKVAEARSETTRGQTPDRAAGNANAVDNKGVPAVAPNTPNTP